MNIITKLKIKIWWMLLCVKWRKFKMNRWLKKNSVPYTTRLFLPAVQGRLVKDIEAWLKLCQEHDLLDRSFPLVWNNKHIVMYELASKEGSGINEYGIFNVIGVYQFGKKPLYIDRRHDGTS